MRREPRRAARFCSISWTDTDTVPSSVRDFVEVIAAAYRVEQSPDVWLRTVVEAAEPLLDRGSGVIGYFIDLSDGVRAWQPCSTDASLDVDAFWAAYARAVPPEEIKEIHTHAPAAWSAAFPERASAAKRWSEENAMHALGVSCLDVSLRGATLSAFDRGDRPPPSAAELERWALVSAHIATGARLVQRLDAAGIEAIVSPSGKILHVEGDARSKAARESLRHAARQMDRARTHRQRRRDQDEAIGAWKALVSGRWSLVDSFESDGRRFVLARRNEATPRAMPLTLRERQVVAAAALGHSNKLIAYELGLGASTISTLLARARHKLGLTTRGDLIRWARRNEL